MYLRNLSNGKTDGIVIMYSKDGVIYPVGLNKEEAEILDLTLGMCFKDKLTVYTDKPMGSVKILK